MVIEPIQIEGDDPRWNMPYTPAIKVTGGSLVFISGVTAAPVYHSHPHRAEEFEGIPADPGRQAEQAMENLNSVLTSAGGSLWMVVQLMRFIVDLADNQDSINRVLARYLGDHRPATTTVEVVRLATDPRLVLELQAIAVVE
jgi:enamine deaminase RidA (YjgF/YER057c/UK114 family)